MPPRCHSICFHLGEIEQHAAFERHRLAVVAGAGAAAGEGNAQLRAGGRDRDHVRLVARRDDDVGGLAVQLLVEDRRVPEIIARAQPHALRVGRDRHVADRAHQAVDVVAGGGGRRRRAGIGSVSLPSETGIRSGPAQSAQRRAIHATRKCVRPNGDVRTQNGPFCRSRCGFRRGFPPCLLPGQAGAVFLGMTAGRALFQRPESPAYLLLGMPLVSAAAARRVPVKGLIP